MGLESLLLGSALVGPTASGAALAGGSAGLFGTAGAFSLGTTLSTLGAAATGLGTLSSITGGMAGSSAAGYQAELAAQQAEAQAIEETRLANKEAKVMQEDAENLARRQRVAYLASGVDLAGSPLLVMEETRRKGAENVAEILSSGSAASSAARAEGRVRAAQFKNQGRSAFMSGAASGLTTAAGGLNTYSQLKKKG